VAAGEGFVVDPQLKTWAENRQREYIDAINEYGSISAAARAMGLHTANVSRSIHGLKARAAAAGYSPEHDMTRTVPEGFTVRGVSTYYDRDGKAAGQWVKSSADAEARERLMLARIEGFKDELPTARAIEAPTFADDDLLTIYPQGDPHAGLASWKDETGAHFDLVEFERINRAAIDRLVASAPPSATALFNDKGDSTHADDNSNRTRKSGHELDVIGRHSEVVRVVIRLKRYQVARLLERHRKVIIRIDPGNHDSQTALFLALIQEAHYQNEPRVEVITSPNPYWYMGFGANLIGTCHGDGAKGKDLPLLMAVDAPQLWAASESGERLFIAGHVHHKDQKDYPGVTVEYVRTLAAPDYYSHHAGYRSKRSMDAITLHKADGIVERQTCSLGRINRLQAAVADVMGA